MATSSHTCVTIACDSCAFVLGATGDDPFHFNTADEARAHAQSAGWFVHKDQARCARCLQVSECERFGHPWQAGLTANGALSGRVCPRCLACEPVPTPKNPPGA